MTPCLTLCSGDCIIGGGMLTKAKTIRILMVAAVAPVVLQSAGAQAEKTKATAGATANTAKAAVATSAASDTPNVAKSLRAAADALGMVRWSDVGAGNVHLPAIDVINTIEFWGSGT